MLLQAVVALGGWSWWLLGFVLLAVEVFAPGFFFLWFGIAAVITGGLALLLGWAWQVQVLAFAVLALASALLGRGLLGYRNPVSADPHLNLRAERLKGQTFLLADPIVEGSGRVRVADSVWQVRGPDAPAGARVVVTGADGTVLRVERA